MQYFQDLFSYKWTSDETDISEGWEMFEKKPKRTKKVFKPTDSIPLDISSTHNITFNITQTSSTPNITQTSPTLSETKQTKDQDCTVIKSTPLPHKHIENDVMLHHNQYINDDDYLNPYWSLDWAKEQIYICYYSCYTFFKQL